MFSLVLKYYACMLLAVEYIVVLTFSACQLLVMFKLTSSHIRDSSGLTLIIIPLGKTEGLGLSQPGELIIKKKYSYTAWCNTIRFMVLSSIKQIG